ncbi:hypothetical protein LTS17_011227 [Exophiala oligosperma]
MSKCSTLVPAARFMVSIAGRLLPSCLAFDSDVSNYMSVHAKRAQSPKAPAAAGHTIDLAADDCVATSQNPAIPGADDGEELGDHTHSPRLPNPPTPTDIPSLFVHSPIVSGTGVQLLEEVTSPSIDEFHNSSFLSRSAILGQDFPELDHTHPDRTAHEFRLSEADLKVLEIHKAFDLPRLAVRQCLFEAVLNNCWTWMPVLDADASFPKRSSLGILETKSILLLQSLMLVGSYMTGGQHIDIPLLAHYRRVKAIIDSGVERNPYKLLIAACLIQWCAPSAPRDISMDSPRFWNMYAISLAQQMGLHRKPLYPTPNDGLRKRIWWTLFARDSLSASAHGRPRLINLADCTVEKPSLLDFPDPADVRAQIFISWVSICEILHDICLSLSRPDGATLPQKQMLSDRLLDYIRNLSPTLRLTKLEGAHRPYDFQLAQLHVTILTAITILHRPASIFNISPLYSSALSITASHLSVKIFEAMELRGHTQCLSSAYTWSMLVAAIPQLSALCCVPALAQESGQALDTIETSLQSFSRVRMSAVNNLANVKAIRKAISVQQTNNPDLNHTRRGQDHAETQESSHLDNSNSIVFNVERLLQPYGPSALKYYESNANILRPFIASTIMPGLSEARGGMRGLSDRDMEMNGWQDEGFGSVSRTNADAFNLDFQLLVGDDFQETGWMRNWIEDLELFDLEA